MRRFLLLVPVLVLNLASLAAAQPAAPANAPEDKPWLASVWAVIFAAFIVVASIKKSKREHRD